MKSGKANDNTGSTVKGIFSSPFNNALTGKEPINSNGTPKTYDYGNATKGFEVEGYSEKGQGIIQGPGCANGDQKR